MKIFITGGTGFIGKTLVKSLANTDHELVCLARKTSDTRTLKAAGVKVVTGDVMDKESLKRGMRGCDWVVHLASNFEFWLPNRKIYQEVNIQGIRNLMESVLEEEITKVVHISTIAVYGNANWPITEGSEYGQACASEYAQTKRKGDEIAWKMVAEQGLPLVVVYPGAVVGSDDPKACGRYIKNFARHRMPAQVLVDAPFCWVYVEDVCQAIVKALLLEGNIGEKYFVSAANMTFGEVNKIVCDIAGVSLPALRLPDSLTVISARLLTAISDLIKSPPLLDLAVDQVALMKQGFRVDASKAERELGIHYTPIRNAFEAAVVSCI
jgi:dihydroflavonol-4-reductase